VPGGKVADQAVVVQPHLDRERRIRAKRLVAAAVERVDDLPGPADHEQEPRFGQQVGPELEVQGGAGILPAPRHVPLAPRGHELLSFLTEPVGHLGRGHRDEALRHQPVGPEHELVPLHELEVLEVPRLVAPV
jgi:hypothetical protein